MSLSGIILALGNTYSFVIFVYVMLSWFPVGNGGVLQSVYEALGKICDPYLNIFRRFIPPIGGTIDVSPIVAFIVLQFVVYILVIIL